MMHARPARSTPVARHRYAPEIREAAVAAAREGLSQGRSLTGLAKEMALPLTTLQRWMTRRPPAFRPVTVTAAPAAVTGLTLRTAHGHCVEGLDVATAVALLRALEASA